MSNDDSLKAFIHHGVTFNAKSGNQAIGDCPFCGKTAHFYANVEKKLWDCKVCGAHGNQGQFLEQILLINVFWTVVNLLPVLPLDGGQLLRLILDWLHLLRP